MFFYGRKGNIGMRVYVNIVLCELSVFLFLFSNKNSDFSVVEIHFVPKSTKRVRNLINLKTHYEILLYPRKIFKDQI